MDYVFARHSCYSRAPPTPKKTVCEIERLREEEQFFEGISVERGCKNRVTLKVGKFFVRALAREIGYKDQDLFCLEIQCCSLKTQLEFLPHRLQYKLRPQLLAALAFQPANLFFVNL